MAQKSKRPIDWHGADTRAAPGHAVRIRSGRLATSQRDHRLDNRIGKHLRPAETHRGEDAGAVRLWDSQVLGRAVRVGSGWRRRRAARLIAGADDHDAGAVRVIEPIVVTMRNNTLPRSVSEPLTTISTSGTHHMLIEAFIASYYGTKNVRRVSQPLPTVTTKDRFALVEPVIIDGQYLDIRVRMLRTHELAGAMSLDGYTFEGNQTEQKKQIGNAVPRRLATALCMTHLAHFAGRRRPTREKRAA
jgi:site-specific DNA-cytosine methylase